jgi:uncharacterized membrane protein
MTAPNLAPLESAAIPAATPRAAQRDIAIDWLRGLVMVVMALDHARDFACGMSQDPTNLETTTPILFATRVVTHYCAPVFVFLSGTAAYLYARNKPRAALTSFLVSRGLWLVVLEETLVRFAWIPDPAYHQSVMAVIWAIGWSMIALAAVSRLPMAGVLAFGLSLVLGHNLLDSIHAARFGELAWLWKILHEPGALVLAPGHVVIVVYPLVPWIGVIALGYAFGAIATRAADERRAIVLRLGLCVTGLFFVVRGLNGYGDPAPWSVQRSALFTAMSFVNTTKYPPSLAYLCMTLGPALILLALAPRDATARWAKPLVVFGRVPLFYYLAHLYVLRIPLIAVAAARLGARALRGPSGGTAGSPELSLAYAYFAWIAAVVLLYPVCRWYAGIKASGRYPLLRYL